MYVWNLWSFHHELTSGHSPFFTRQILASAPWVDLSLHNYTVLLDVAALPLLQLFDVTTTFNLIYLLTVVATALGAFLLVRHLVWDAGVAWIAGALFGFSPFMTARSTGHFSLVAAAPLPLFALTLIRLEETGRARWAVAAGLVLSLAFYGDVYYGVYCAMLAAVFAASRIIRVSPRRFRGVLWVRHLLEGAIAGVAALTAAVALTGGWTLELGGVRVGLRTLYAPVLLLVVLILSRIWLRSGLRFELTGRATELLRPRLAAGMLAAAVVPLIPWLYAFVYRLGDGGSVSEQIFWRSSPRGVDLLSLVVPNPTHKLFGRSFWEWLSRQPGLAIENVASLSLVALAIVVVAFWRYRATAPVFWWLVATGAALLSLGPFVHVGGVNTFVPGPWALLRYVPIVSGARTPARFAVVASLGLAVLFACGLRQILSEHRSRRRPILLAVGALVLFELLPAPRVLHSARIPAIYRTIAYDPRDISVLSLPFGFRDGVRSYGRYNTATQFYQTFHRKRTVGGYISRLSRGQIRRQLGVPKINTYVRLSEGGKVEALPPHVLRERGRRFIERVNLGYVVVDLARTPRPLLERARESFELEFIAESDGLALYRPARTAAGQGGGDDSGRGRLLVPRRPEGPDDPQRSHRQ